MMASPPPELRRAAAANNLRGDVLAIRVVAQLLAVGIRAILLKGPAIRLWLYQDGSPRAYGDIDLLLEPDLIEEAESVLSEHGWERPVIDPWDREGPWHARDLRNLDGAHVELHRTLSGIRVDPPQAWRVLSEHTADLALRRARVEALDIPARAMHVALHAAQDGGRNAQSSEDLRRAVEQVDVVGWQSAFEVAAALDAVPAFATGLRLDAKGVSIADDLELPRASTVELILRRSASSAPHALEWVAGRPRPSDRALAVIRKTFPSLTFMKTKYERARQGPVGLTVAYLQRLMWLLVAFPSAFKAWRRARQEVNRHDEQTP